MDRRGDELPADELRLDYRAAGVDGKQAAEVMRARLSAAGVSDASVSTGSDGRLVVSGPPDAREEIEALTVAGRLEIYDWEASVLGPDGRPAPGDPRVTGGDDAGMSAATSLPQAEPRAAVTGGRVGRTLSGAPERWYAVGGEPALTNAGIASAGTASDVCGEPAVTLEFTQEGRAAFGSLTRELARRGEERNAWQHLTIVLDDRIVAIPRIDFRERPDGIDGSSGALISGGLSPESARRIAAILDSGPLPAGR